MATQSFSFGRDATPEAEEAQLEAALQWLCEKHEFLYDEPRQLLRQAGHPVPGLCNLRKRSNVQPNLC